MCCNLYHKCGIQLKLKAENYTILQRQTGESDHFFFADLSFLYKLDKIKTDISVGIFNLPNVKLYKMNQVSANNYNQTAVLLRPRMMLITALFNL